MSTSDDVRQEKLFSKQESVRFVIKFRSHLKRQISPLSVRLVLVMQFVLEEIK